jgi:hypothetical protein
MRHRTIRASTAFAAFVAFASLSALLVPSTAAAEDVDLVVYADARSGFGQKYLGPYTAADIHGALTGALGRLADLAPQRGILFLGDAVSQGGCHDFWEKKFRPKLKNLDAFRDPQSSLFFYPVIGDHETYLIPESPDEAANVPPLCKVFDVIYPFFLEDLKKRNEKQSFEYFSAPKRRAELVKRLEAIHESTLSSFRTYGQIVCPEVAPPECSNPGIESNEMLLAHCMMCQYQRQVCNGNCVTYAFTHEFAAQYGFGPFQGALSKEPAGSTWYAKDYTVGTPPRVLRVLMLDTQTAPLTKPTGGAVQNDWIAAQVRPLPRGSILIAVGHQPPAMVPGLWDAVLRAVRENKGVQLLSLMAAHYHGFGGGAYAVWDGETRAFKKVYVGASGDGGGRDFSVKEAVTEDRILRDRALGRFQFQPVGGNEAWRVDSTNAAVSFLRIHLGETGAVFGEWQVPLSVTTSAGGDASLSGGTPVMQRQISIPYE